MPIVKEITTGGDATSITILPTEYDPRQTILFDQQERGKLSPH